MSERSVHPEPGSSTGTLVGPLVVKVGGDAIDDPGFGGLCAALGRLGREVAGGVVLVHGGGKGVDRQLERLGLTSERREGLRITPPEIMDQITGVLAGITNTAVVGAMTSRGIPAVGLTLGDGFVSVCEPLRPGFEVGRVGDVGGGDPRLLRALLARGFVPVLSCVGLDAAGRTLNVNADHAARGIARILGAGGLLLLTDVAGVLGGDGRVIERIDRDGIEGLIAQGVIDGGMIPKARAAADAAEAAGVPAIIASWRTPGDLLRLARGESLGTLVEPRRRA